MSLNENIKYLYLPNIDKIDDNFLLVNKSLISIYSSAWWHISILPGILHPKDTTFLKALAYVAPGQVIGSLLRPVTSLNTLHRVVTK